MTFEHGRGGTIHHYEIRDDALVYSAGSLTRIELPWTEFRALSPGRDFVCFVRANKQKIGIWLNPTQLAQFIPTALAAWEKAAPGVARKAAFDYSVEPRALGWLWLLLSLFFPCLLGISLLADGLSTARCDRLLERGNLASAEVLKVKKDRRGNFTWDLQFTTDTGLALKGRRTPFSYDEKGMPSGPVTVVYAPESPGCWDVSTKPGENALNARQRYFTQVTGMGFGSALTALGAIFAAAGVGRIRRKHPYREMIKNAL